jgi:hypothetical protein
MAKTARPRQQGQDCTRQHQQDSTDRTARTRQSEQDSYGKTAETNQLVQDSKCNTKRQESKENRREKVATTGQRGFHEGQNRR